MGLFNRWNGWALPLAAGVAFFASAAAAQTPEASLFSSYTFSVDASPPKGGVVARNPSLPGYRPGTRVNVMATPAKGYAFIGWSGAASGKENPVMITVNSDAVLTANFQKAYPLEAKVSPSGGGFVSREPNNGVYLAGDKVTVTAVPATGYAFAGWSGAAVGTDNPVAVSINGKMKLTANFLKQPAIAPAAPPQPQVAATTLQSVQPAPYAPPPPPPQSAATPPPTQPEPANAPPSPPAPPAPVYAPPPQSAATPPPTQPEPANAPPSPPAPPAPVYAPPPQSAATTPPAQPEPANAPPSPPTPPAPVYAPPPQSAATVPPAQPEHALEPEPVKTPRAPARFSVGGGASFTNSPGGGLVWEAPDAKLAMPYLGGGAYLFFDAAYTEIFAGFSFETGKWQSGSVSAQTTLPDMRRAYVNAGVFAKYPIAAGSVTLFPLLGVDYEAAILGKLKAGGYEEYVFDGKVHGNAAPRAAGSLSALWFKAGAGIDAALGQSICLRVEALYGYRGATKFEKDEATRGDAKAMLASGLTARVGVGVKFGGRGAAMRGDEPAGALAGEPIGAPADTPAVNGEPVSAPADNPQSPLEDDESVLEVP